MARSDGRSPEGLRDTSIECGVIPHAEGSVLIRAGGTHVICTASVEDKVPPFRKGSGAGWITAEYAMIPRATLTRNERDISRLKLNGRSAEIQRLIGRALRSVADLSALGERTVTVDCDVIRADGGTRTASITGGFVALAMACGWMLERGLTDRMPLSDFVAAASAGIVGGEALLDLCYEEDAAAEVDMNVVMTGGGRFVEIQATGEESTFTEEQHAALIRLAREGIRTLTGLQRGALGGIAERIGAGR